MMIKLAIWEDIFTFLPTVRVVTREGRDYVWYVSIDWIKFSLAFMKKK